MANEETYIVRLLFEVPTTGHKEAVSEVVDQLARYGILNWVYRSQRLADGEIEHFDGDLQPIDLEDLKRQLEDSTIEPPVTYERPEEATGETEDAEGS